MRIHGWIGAFFLCLLCLGGCGKEKIPADSCQTSENIETPGNMEVLGDVDWEKGFPVSDTVEEETALWAARYDGWESRYTGFAVYIRRKKAERSETCWKSTTYLPDRPHFAR